MHQSNSDTLVNFLNDPGSYPHNPPDVVHIQTHASHVFIASPFVYKIKKAVNFGFLDFSSLEKRRHFCEQEVELNRRLCSDIYLGVIPLYSTETGWSFENLGGRDPVEYAVKMKKLSGDGLLKNLLRKGELTTEHLRRVIETLVRFYERQRIAADSSISGNGQPDAIRFNIEENYRQTKPFVGRTIDHGTYDAIQVFTDRFLNEHSALLKKRVRENRIVDGHGDLHLEHIHLSDKRVCIFDCIEFNTRFRYLDVASEISFLSMDLDFNAEPRFGRYVLDRLAEELRDPEMLPLTDLYKCYRAYVRGKVKSLESSDDSVPAGLRDKAATQAVNYFALSLRYALFGSDPHIIVVMGPVASGKSTLAGELSGRLGINRYSSDVIRKQEAGLPVDERTPDAIRRDLYLPEKTEWTYQRLFTLAAKELADGRSAILDATFGNPENRRSLVEQSGDAGMQVIFIETRATNTTRADRLRKRAEKRRVASDARIDDLTMLDSHYRSPDELDPRVLVTVNTGKSPDQTMAELYSALIERRFL